MLRRRRVDQLYATFDERLHDMQALQTRLDEIVQRQGLSPSPDLLGLNAKWMLARRALRRFSRWSRRPAEHRLAPPLIDHRVSKLEIVRRCFFELEFVRRGIHIRLFFVRIVVRQVVVTTMAEPGVCTAEGGTIKLMITAVVAVLAVVAVMTAVVVHFDIDCFFLALPFFFLLFFGNIPPPPPSPPPPSCDKTICAVASASAASRSSSPALLLHL